MKIDAQFISPKTVLFRIDNPQLKARVLKRMFWHIADIPIVVREWSPKTASAHPDLTAVPLWIDLRGVPDHLFSNNGLTFFGDTIGTTVKLHPNTECCVRLDVALLLVVMNLEEPLPESIQVRGSGEILTISYPWLPPRCLGCQKWGHTDANCSKNKKIKDLGGAGRNIISGETSDESADRAVTLVGDNDNSKPIDIEDPVLEAAKLNITEPNARESSTKETNIEQTGGMEVEHECAEHDTPSLQVAPKQVVEHEDNETWLTIPQNKSPLARKTNGKATQRPEVEPPTGSPSRYHLLSNELEEGEVDVEEDSSDEESSVESQTALEKKKQMERQKSGKKKKSQKVNPNINVGLRKDQNKGAKNKQANQASSRRH